MSYDAEYLDDGDDYESDDFGDIIDAEFVDDTPDVSPEVQAYLDENGGWNRDQLHSLHEHMMATNQSVTAFWNEISDTTRRSWKNLVDGFGAYYREHAGVISSTGSEVQHQIYAFIENYLRIKKLIEREISALRARMREPTPSSTTREAASPSPARPASTPSSTRAATPARSMRLPTTAATSASYQSVASGFSVAKLMPWILVGGIAWYIYTNRRSLFA